MLRKSNKSPKLFSDCNTLQFACIATIVMFALLTSMTVPTPYHHGISPDLPKVHYAVSMPWANRDNAMRVTITRDGHIFFGSDQISSNSLPNKIRDRLKDRDVEKKVYIVADFRARWGTIKDGLDSVRAAGILRVAFLADSRAFTTPSQ
jgi:biopolymer transport protein TolR